MKVAFIKVVGTQPPVQSEERGLTTPASETAGGDREARRLAALTIEEMDDAQRDLYGRITGGPRGTGPALFDLVDDHGRLTGPFDAMLRNPRLGDALQELGAAVRYRTGLTDSGRELAILAVAHHLDSAFEIHAHEAVARSVGVREADLGAVREGRHEDLTDGTDRVIAATAHALVTAEDLTAEEYRRAVEILGEEGMFELSTLVGYYRLLALQLRLFRVPAPGTR